VTLRIRRRIPLFVASLTVLASLLVLLGDSSDSIAVVPFNPAFHVFLPNPALSANSNLRIVTTVPAGNNALGTWSVFMPAGWGVTGDAQVPDGDVTVQGTMSVDVDCNGTIDTFGPFNLVDTAVAPGGDAPVAQWSGHITSWWNLLVTVDQVPNQPFDMSADLTNFNVFHNLCAPQTFSLTILGRSSPGNSAVLVNPASAGTYAWGSSFASFGGAYTANASDSTCVGNTCDFDGDGVADISDNCPAWPNASQALPPWLIAANDPDCDGFSSAVEDLAGTNALVHCGNNAWPADVTNDTFSDISDVSALTAYFGMAVPPAPARYNIAPDPVDGFVDITDISKMTGFFGLTCGPCSGDTDCDGVLNAVDNCPNWPNPTQALPPWPVPANDPDCDGFSSGVENSAGTNPLVHCGANGWPADINNDMFSDISDVSALTANFGMSVPPAPARQNIAPDPVDTFVDITDISKMTSFFGLRCN